MSLEISPTLFEIKSDVDGRKVLDHQTKLIPVVQKVVAANVEIIFPNPALDVRTFTRTTGDLWRIHAWGLFSPGSTESGHVDIAAITAPVTPNLIMANVYARRIIAPSDQIWGPFIVAMTEYVWTPVRSGMRLEYNAWMRRIAWLAIEAGMLRLKWKQSSRFYDPNQLDPNRSHLFPEAYQYLKRPPAYQIADYAQQGNSQLPSYPGTPSIHAGPMGAIGFQSRWHFDIIAWLLKV